jgi:DNA-directed RNA polymerase subunit N (RpoN/RPB10)
MRKATEIDPSPKLSNYWQTGSYPRLLLSGVGVEVGAVLVVLGIEQRCCVRLDRHFL